MRDENYALQEAVNIASFSNCKSQRGVVIWHRNFGILSSGYNRPPAPFYCDGSDKCRANCAKTAVHAEQVALIGCISLRGVQRDEIEMLHVKIVNGEAVFSEKPSCWQCSKLILEAGFKSMWLYQKEGLIEYPVAEFHRLTLENCGLG